MNHCIYPFIQASSTPNLKLCRRWVIYRLAPLRSIALIPLFLIALFILFTPAVQAAPCTGTSITGVVFRDYNADGTRAATEAGLAGIVVTAHDATGTVSSCETTTDGSYGIDPAGAYPVRLEFTLPADGSMDYLQPGAVGTNASTSVIFVDAPTANVDTSFTHPADFCGNSPAPTMAVSCFVFGEQNDNPDGINKDSDVLVAFPYTAGSNDLTNEPAVRAPAPTHLASAKEIGSVYGLAWNPNNETIYGAAFMKRHSGFGPNGPGAIYQITPSGPSLFHDFGTTAGTDPHPQPGQTCLSPGHNANNNNFNCWLNDSNSFDQVGKVGFGDLEINETLDTLYTVNLADNTLLAIPIANPGSFTATAVPVPASCPATDLRPLGLGVADGKVYVGAVCSAESTQNREALRAYVFVYANGVFTTTPVLDFSLLYDRNAANLQWQYWLNQTTFDPTNLIQVDGKWAQPWLADIAFDNGDMILGFRDRNGDLFGSVAGGPDPADPNNYSAKARGDILRACADGSGGWTLETNGSCGGVITGGAGNAEGPGGGEYYYQDEQLNPLHKESTFGALAQVAGMPDVVTTIFNPIEGAGAVSDGGIKWVNNSTGMTSRGYLVFDASGSPANFEKANGLGDIEPLCPLAPLEIGNRVWQDTDGDGIQDPDEPGIDGVTVELYRDGILVGTTVTTNGGEYLFNDSNVNQNAANGIVAGLCGPNGETVYEVRIPNAAGASQQAPLNGLSLTLANNDGTANGDLRDSNGTLAGNNALYAIPCSDLSAPGFNNHTYDFGFTAGQIELVAIGNVVFVDFNNNGRFEPSAGEIGVDSAVVALFPAGADPISATPLATTTTAGGGFYLFDNLTPGQYFVHLRAENFQTGAVLANYRSSTGSGTDTSVDDSADENGIDNVDLATNGLPTVVYDLQPNSQPVGESGAGSYGGVLDDDNVNMTADFGVYKPLNLGNRVWLDDGAGGGGVNNGVMDGGEVGIANVLLRLLDSAGNPVLDSNSQPMTTTTDGQGYYNFNDLFPGDYVVLIDATNFAPGGPLSGLNSSDPTEADPNADSDLNDNGINTANPAVDGIRSGLITLAYDTEPTDEVDLGPVGTAQPADSNNLTIDFGFLILPSNLPPSGEPTQIRIYLPTVVMQ